MEARSIKLSESRERVVHEENRYQHNVIGTVNSKVSAYKGSPPPFLIRNLNNKVAYNTPSKANQKETTSNGTSKPFKPQEIK